MKDGRTLLVADVGGTKTELALAEVAETSLQLSAQKRYSSSNASSLKEIITRYMREHAQGISVSAGCFALAGPVQNGECKLTNLPWQNMREQELSVQLSFPVTFINDFEAIGHAIPSLDESDFISLQEGERNNKGTIAYLGAGTGLGEGFLSRSHTGYQVHPSEGGHSSFSPHTEEERELHHYLLTEEKLPMVCFEDILSGSGIERIYRFLCHKKEQKALLKDASAIGDAALSGTCRVSRHAIELFFHIYGIEAANLALKTLARGGVYIAGGIAPRLKDLLNKNTFLHGFLDAGDYTPLLKTIPLRLSTAQNIALRGAALAIQNKT